MVSSAMLSTPCLSQFAATPKQPVPRTRSVLSTAAFRVPAVVLSPLPSLLVKYANHMRSAQMAHSATLSILWRSPPAVPFRQHVPRTTSVQQTPVSKVPAVGLRHILFRFHLPLPLPHRPIVPLPLLQLSKRLRLSQLLQLFKAHWRLELLVPLVSNVQMAHSVTPSTQCSFQGAVPSKRHAPQTASVQQTHVLTALAAGPCQLR